MGKAAAGAAAAKPSSTANRSSEIEPKTIGLFSNRNGQVMVVSGFSSLVSQTCKQAFGLLEVLRSVLGSAIKVPDLEQQDGIVFPQGFHGSVQGLLLVASLVDFYHVHALETVAVESSELDLRPSSGYSGPTFSAGHGSIHFDGSDSAAESDPYFEVHKTVLSVFAPRRTTPRGKM